MAHLPKSIVQNLLRVSNRAEWRSWLEEYHDNAQETWLVYFKKHTGKTGISYAESVEEAICFGWIDGLKRSIDEQRYTHRFSPRRARSRWTPLNIIRARSMIEQNKMTPAGLGAFERRSEYEEEFNELRKRKELPVPAVIRDALKAKPTAWKNFQALAPGYRKQYILWLTTAKKAETRSRRLEEAIRKLELNEKPGMK